MDISICYLTNNKNTLEMERRYKLLPKNTNNFLIFDNSTNLKYNSDIQTFIFDFDLSKISKSPSPFHKKTIHRFTYICLLYFYEKYPNYDYYWLLEDDLLFNGDFSLFFNETNKLNQDLLIGFGHYKHKESNKTWYSDEMNRIFGGFEHDFPLAGGFIGIQRWSNRFAKLLYENTFEKGFYGYTESFPATLAYLNDMNIGFLDETFKENKLYIKEFCNPGARFNINQLKNLPNNTLIHAVKF
jgi:hypothetical protein